MVLADIDAIRRKALLNSSGARIKVLSEAQVLIRRKALLIRRKALLIRTFWMTTKEPFFIPNYS